MSSLAPRPGPRPNSNSNSNSDSKETPESASKPETVEILNSTADDDADAHWYAPPQSDEPQPDDALTAFRRRLVSRERTIRLIGAGHFAMGLAMIFCVMSKWRELRLLLELRGRFDNIQGIETLSHQSAIACLIMIGASVFYFLLWKSATKFQQWFRPGSVTGVFLALGLLIYAFDVTNGGLQRAFGSEAFYLGFALWAFLIVGVFYLVSPGTAIVFSHSYQESTEHYADLQPVFSFWKNLVRGLGWIFVFVSGLACLLLSIVYLLRILNE